MPPTPSDIRVCNIYAAIPYLLGFTRSYVLIVINSNRLGRKMFHKALHKIRHGLRLLWYFLTDKPPLYTVLEDKLDHLPETQAQRIMRRWQRSAAALSAMAASDGPVAPSAARRILASSAAASFGSVCL